jgi:hypothetical protein
MEVLQPLAMKTSLLLYWQVAMGKEERMELECTRACSYQFQLFECAEA